MLVFIAPMVIAFVLIGIVTGWIVGRQTWGNAGGVMLAMGLGLPPAIVGFASGMFLLWNSKIMP